MRSMSWYRCSRSSFAGGLQVLLSLSVQTKGAAVNAAHPQYQDDPNEEEAFGVVLSGRIVEVLEKSPLCFQRLSLE